MLSHEGMPRSILCAALSTRSCSFTGSPDAEGPSLSSGDEAKSGKLGEH